MAPAGEEYVCERERGMTKREGNDQNSSYRYMKLLSNKTETK